MSQGAGRGRGDTWLLGRSVITSYITTTGRGCWGGGGAHSAGGQGLGWRVLPGSCCC